MLESAHSPAVQSALRQARRERRRGRHRKVMLLHRKAVYQQRDRAPLWNRYALSCLRDGRAEEAQRAFAQSIWLDRKCGNHRRAEVTEELARRAQEGQWPT